MTARDPRLSRREMLAWGSAIAALPWLGAAPPAGVPPRVPTRPFGRSGERVSILGLGGYFDASAHPELLALALARGVNYWEITLAKGGAGYGEHFRKHPGDRTAVFLLAKTRVTEPEAMTRDLARALEQAATPHVDFFTVQGLSDPDLLTPAVRAWADAQKLAGRIRHFGFTSHANMVPCLRRAATLPWIDGVVTAYNYRLMEEAGMRDAIAACADAGIALTAIKTQALLTNPEAQIGAETPIPVTGGDAKLRAVWSDARFASALSLMPDAAMLEANCAAARVPVLAARERDALREHARATASLYCAGCAQLCEPHVAGQVPISRVLRYAMYADGYGDVTRARAAFAALPAATRHAIASADYAGAERACPRGIAIGRAMRRASALLS